MSSYTSMLQEVVEGLSRRGHSIEDRGPDWIVVEDENGRRFEVTVKSGTEESPWRFDVPKVPDGVRAFKDKRERVWLRLADDTWALSEWSPEYLDACESAAKVGVGTSGYPLIDLLDVAPLVEHPDPRSAK